MYLSSISLPRTVYKINLISVRGLAYSIYNLFIEQANWYIGLCYLKTNENKKAFDTFKYLANKNGFYRSNALSILQKIKYTE